MQALPAIDVTADNFQLEVLQQSMHVPVLLDFWADWCGPCKALGPVLEKLAAEYGGSFVLGKVNTEVEYELAAAFQVRSIPFVVLLDRGRPIDAFTGALPEAEVRRFLKRNGIEPVVQGRPAPPDPNSPAGRFARAVEAARKGDAATARAALTDFPIEDELAGPADRLRDGLEWLENRDLPSGPAGDSIREAREHFLAGRIPDALEALLRSVEIDRGFADGLARRAMLLCFAVLGEDHDVSDEYRRRLTTLLY
ncbi:MAG TPA: tetratricopeptide repeat protein [Planctomycetota bacterium]|nr:tetratricopeptide repeat protein [Planctomycetota bacterium]